RAYFNSKFNQLKYFIARMRVCGNCSPLVYNCRSYSDSKFLRAFLEIISSPYGLFKYLFYKPKPLASREGLAIAAIAKNEGPYIKEWIEFYVKQGVSHFLIYDNDSTDNMHEVLQPFIAQGIVTYKKLPGKARQYDAYNMAIHDYKDKFRYMAMLDLDEFCFCLEHDKNLYEFVDEFMKSHEHAGGIGANWLLFGSSGHETKPVGGVLENYLMCAEKDFGPNHLVKTICDPEKVLCFLNPHLPMYIRSYHNFNENGGIIRDAITDKVSFSKIRINHYYCKSKEEYIIKKNRGLADNKNNIRKMSDFYDHDQNIIKDTEILSHI
ncbi:MAG: glycosyltransferase family 92 protein, partial [Synergistaceae bacterium]|nr:glycosyltransferase family 92 protein [Synergistaceae bacterium]